MGKADRYAELEEWLRSFLRERGWSEKEAARRASRIAEECRRLGILDAEARTLRCERCGHEWVYTGRLRRATCPSCGTKVLVKGVEE